MANKVGRMNLRVAVPGAVALVTAAASAAMVPAAVGDPVSGKTVFQSAGCAGCHTLAAAGAAGTVGPNLDLTKPPYDLAVSRVTSGSGGMPSFSGSLNAQKIADVAAFVTASTGGTLPPPPPPAPPGASSPPPPGTGSPGANPPGGRTDGPASLPQGLRVVVRGGSVRSPTTKVAAGVVNVSVRNAGDKQARLLVGRGPRPRKAAPTRLSKLLTLKPGAVRRVTLRLRLDDQGFVCRVTPRRPAPCVLFRAVAKIPVPGTTPSAGAPASEPAAPTTPPEPTTPPPAPTPPPSPPPPADGKSLFVANCGGCHTLADAGTTGRTGPNLDQLAPSTSDLRDQIRSGGGGMPAFRNVLTAAQIEMIVVYVASVT